MWHAIYSTKTKNSNWQDTNDDSNHYVWLSPSICHRADITTSVDKNTITYEYRMRIEFGNFSYSMKGIGRIHFHSFLSFYFSRRSLQKFFTKSYHPFWSQIQLFGENLQNTISWTVTYSDLSSTFHSIDAFLYDHISHEKEFWQCNWSITRDWKSIFSHFLSLFTKLHWLASKKKTQNFHQHLQIY